MKSLPRGLWALLLAPALSLGCQSAEPSTYAQDLDFALQSDVASLNTQARVLRSYELADADLTNVPALDFRRRDGSLVVGSARGDLVLFVGPEERPQLLARGAPILDLRVLPGDRHVLTLREDGELVLRALDTSRVSRSVEASSDATCLALDADGQRVALACDEEIEIRALPSLELIETLEDEGAPIGDLVWTARGDLAWVRDDGALRLRRANARSVQTRRLPKALHAVAASPDGRHLAYGGEDTKVWRLDLETGQQDVLAEHQPFWITTISYSPDGRRLALGDESCDVWILDLEDRQRIVHDKHHVECWLTRALWSTDGKRFLFGCRSNTHSDRPQVYAPNVVREVGREPATRRLQAIEDAALEQVLLRAEGVLSPSDYRRFAAAAKPASTWPLGFSSAALQVNSFGFGAPLTVTEEQLPSQDVMPFFGSGPYSILDGGDAYFTGGCLNTASGDSEIMERVKAHPELASHYGLWIHARSQRKAHVKGRGVELGKRFQINVWELTDVDASAPRDARAADAPQGASPRP